MRRYLILAPGQFRDNAKTAHGVIAYGHDEIAAIVDPAFAGKTVRDVLPYLENDAPIVGCVREGLAFGPTALLLGTAPLGGQLPQEWRNDVLAALQAGLEIVSGLHDMLGEDAEFARIAKERGAAIWDVRRVPAVPLFCGDAYRIRQPVILTVGNDCAVGKMTVCLELARAARARGIAAEFVPTGQTGIMIAGWGISVDRVISDFAAGAAEQLVLAAAAKGPDYLLVEGQGAINHPAYAPVTLALMYGAAPDALILVCHAGRTHIEAFGTPILRYAQLVATYEALLATVKPAPVIAIALNTRDLSELQAREALAAARAETGLPVADVVRDGPQHLWDAVAPLLHKMQPLADEVPA
ncbi:MAG: DUF1611 domain-containing protein [Candidatus Eremiobacteraeota bacterium]|nr:DUF1611 domain-containing protein [Candidatus Eremiobacteraeota bacterium]